MLVYGVGACLWFREGWDEEESSGDLVGGAIFFRIIGVGFFFGFAVDFPLFVWAQANTNSLGTSQNQKYSPNPNPNPSSNLNFSSLFYA